MNLDHPVYQVNIYERLDEPAGAPEEQRAYHVHEWKLHDAEITEVLKWAEQKAGGGEYTVEVASVISDGDSHLLRLYGHNPNRGAEFNDPYALVSDDVILDPQWFISKMQGEDQ